MRGVALCFAICVACEHEPTVVTVEPVASHVATAPVDAASLLPVRVALEQQPDINFENVVHLVEYRIEPARAARGERVRFTFTWRCDAALDQGWQLLTHVADPSGKTDNIDFNGPLREPDLKGHQKLGPDRWEVGKVYVDRQTYVVPDWATGTLTVLVGIWRGSARLHVITGPNDGEYRAIAGKIELK